MMNLDSRYQHSRYNIIRLDSVKRFIDLTKVMRSKKMIYFDLCQAHGQLWKSYAHFNRYLFYFKYSSHNQSSPRAAFINEFNFIISQEMDTKIFNIIDSEYPGLWRSSTHFNKRKHHYIKHSVIQS